MRGLRKVQRASGAIVAFVSIQKFKDITRLIQVQSASQLKHITTPTHSKHNIIEKQDLIKSDTLPRKILQRQQAQIPYPRKIRYTPKLCIALRRCNPTLPFRRRSNLILMRHRRERDIPRNPQFIQLPIQLSQRPFCIIVAPTLVYADENIFRPELRNQSVERLVPVAAQDLLIIPIHTCDVYPLFSCWLIALDAPCFAYSLLNEVEFYQAPADED